MSKMFYMKLAAENIKKNSQTYIPYMLTCIGAIMMYYIMTALTASSGLKEVFGGENLVQILGLGCWVLALFCVIFLFYTHSFLTKRRKKEFGIFNIVGMEKRHIARILGYETIYVTVICLGLGIVGGILLSRLFQLILIKLIKIQTAIRFELSLSALGATVGLFLVIFVMTFLNSLRQIHLANPIELLAGDKTGEREPKTKWFMTVVGLLCLGAGYAIAIIVKSPLEVILLFLVAIILVMIGTYCLFTAGSIAFLKSLKKNKGYYYQTKHFVSVSGMIYRMKQNAVGLANICILSTGILLMVSAAVSLYVGIEDSIISRYPHEIMIEMVNCSDAMVAEMQQIVTKTCTAAGITPVNEEREQFWLVKAVQSGSDFTELPEGQDAAYLYFTTLDSYNQTAASQETLKANEVLLISRYGTIPGDSLRFGELSFTVKEELDSSESGIGIVSQMYYFVVSDLNSIRHIFGELGENIDGNNSFTYQYSFNTNSEPELQDSLVNELQQRCAVLSQSDSDGNYIISGREQSRNNFYLLYGGLFFVGILMGVIFLMATVLIIYYKQISEGYDDSQRFIIMKKVGMSHAEIRQSIRSQVMTVFFIPLGMACLHMAFAFPLMVRLMALLNLTNVLLYTAGSVATVLVFAVIYGIVYLLTARVYYRIVSKAGLQNSN